MLRTRTTVWTDGLTSLDRYKGRCYDIESVAGEVQACWTLVQAQVLMKLQMPAAAPSLWFQILTRPGREPTLRIRHPW